MSNNVNDLLDALVRDPDQAEQTAKRLADLVSGSGANIVAVDPKPGSVIMGHIVARQLRASLIIVSEDSGLLYASTLPSPGSKIALISEEFPDYPSLGAVADYLTANSASIVAAASVVLFHGDVDSLSVTPTSLEG